MTNPQVALQRAIAAAAGGPDGYLPCWGDPDFWFSDSQVDQRFASGECGRCPVRFQCLAAAKARGELHGVWGGMVFPLPKAVPSA